MERKNENMSQNRPVTQTNRRRSRPQVMYLSSDSESVVGTASKRKTILQWTRVVVHARMKSSQPLVYSVEDELEAYKHASARFTDRWHRDAPFLFNTGDFVEGENLPTT